MSNPLFIGEVTHHFERLTSTNDYAQELLSKSNPSEGTVISTDNQYQGRGQIGSLWESAPGRNLTLSVILMPMFLKADQQFLLNQAISIAIKYFISAYCSKTVHIKWPNDIMVDGKKIGGILIQNNLQGHQIVSSIIGLGININQKLFTEAPNPTSFALQSGQFYDLSEIKKSLYAHLEHWYLQLKSQPKSQIQSEYLSHLYRYRENTWFIDQQEQRFEGSIVGLEETGRLKIVSNGKIRSFGIKEISFLK